MLRLLGGHSDMTLATCCHFLRRRTGGGSASPAVETGPIDRGAVIDDSRVVGIVHDSDIHIGHRAVVVVGSTSPVAAEKAGSGIAETVVNAAIEAHLRSPIARRPNVQVVFEGPIPRSPEETDFRRLHPRARNPEVAVRTISPIARDPNEASFRTNRLYVHWQHGRTKLNGHADGNLRSGLNRDRQ